MVGVVYAICALTALACAVLLLRGYSQNKAHLLLWSGLCFVGLTVNNVLVIVDVMVFPDVNLLLWRNLAGLGSMALLLFGLIWDAK